MIARAMSAAPDEPKTEVRAMIVLVKSDPAKIEGPGAPMIDHAKIAAQDLHEMIAVRVESAPWMGLRSAPPRTHTSWKPLPSHPKTNNLNDS
jgi:hypothetical protein